jgi:hypothetical protein
VATEDAQVSRTRGALAGRGRRGHVGRGGNNGRHVLLLHLEPMRLARTAAARRCRCAPLTDTNTHSPQHTAHSTQHRYRHRQRAAEEQEIGSAAALGIGRCRCLVRISVRACVQACVSVSVSVAVADARRLARTGGGRAMADVLACHNASVWVRAAGQDLPDEHHYTDGVEVVFFFGYARLDKVGV